MTYTQAQTAEWMGYGSDQVAINWMNADHDPLHQRLCDWLGIRSTSMMIARGEPTTGPEQCLAGYEEDAVLHVQRFIQHARNMGEI